MSVEIKSEERRIVSIRCIVCNDKGCKYFCEGCGEFYCDDHLSLAAKRHANCEGDDLHLFKKMKIETLMKMAKKAVTIENGALCLGAGTGALLKHYVSWGAVETGQIMAQTALSAIGNVGVFLPIAALLEGGYHVYRYLYSNDPSTSHL